jgi:cytochrome c
MNRVRNVSMVLAALLALAANTSHAQDAQDAVALGKKLTTNNCAVCHTFGKGEPNGQGPNLFGIIGRPLASEAGFKYSAGMKAAAAGKVWDDKLLDAWLTYT